MAVSTKIEFRQRGISQVADVTDIVALLFPNNRNQQYAAVRILLFLKGASDPVASLSVLETQHSISRRTLQRTRAKLTQLGLIEHVTWMNTRFGGRQGWRLSSRMASALRVLAQKLEDWRNDVSANRDAKDQQLAELLR